MKNLMESIGDACGIPKDISLDMPHISLSANKELYIENYKTLISYSSEQLITGSRKYIIKFTGKNIEIKSIRREDMLVIGEFSHIEYKLL